MRYFMRQKWGVNPQPPEEKVPGPTDRFDRDILISGRSSGRCQVLAVFVVNPLSSVFHANFMPKSLKYPFHSRNND